LKEPPLKKETPLKIVFLAVYGYLDPIYAWDSYYFIMMHSSFCFPFHQISVYIDQYGHPRQQ